MAHVWEAIECRDGGSSFSVALKGTSVMLGLGQHSINDELNRRAAGAPRTLRPVTDSLRGGQIHW